MPNLMEFLRMANIFAPGQPIGNDLPSQGGITGNMPRVDFGVPDFAAMGNTQVASPDDYDAGARMGQLYQPQTQASDRYNELIGMYPDKSEYKPSMLRRIGAALIATGQSFGGPAGRRFQPNPNALESGFEFLNRPYNEKLGDWKNQIGPAQQAATLERNQNVNDRTLATQTVQQELSQRKIDAANKIAADKNELARIKQMQPNFKFDFTGPTVTITDPKTGQIIQTKVPTGSLSDADKMALQQTQALERIQATGQEQRQTEAVRQDNRQELAWSDPYEVTMPDGSKQYFQTNKADGTVRQTQFPGTATKIGTPPKASGQNPNLEAIQQKTQETLDALDEILDEKGKIKPNMRSAIGASRMLGLQYLPATQTRAGDAAIKRLKSMLIVDLIGEMKAQSRTGATGFGQLNMRELGVLESAASKLDPSLDEDTFEAELKRIREKLKKVLQPSSGMTPTQTTPSGPTAEDLIKKYGGGQ